MAIVQVLGFDLPGFFPDRKAGGNRSRKTPGSLISIRPETLRSKDR